MIACLVVLCVFQFTILYLYCFLCVLHFEHSIIIQFIIAAFSFRRHNIILCVWCVFKDIQVHQEGKNLLINLSFSKNSLSFWIPKERNLPDLTCRLPNLSISEHSGWVRSFGQGWFTVIMRYIRWSLESLALISACKTFQTFRKMEKSLRANWSEKVTTPE